ncbi:endo-1,4-beta-xylanase [Gillisia sp. M10.2A]|uniref:endo-1,4-beta-xylanase n=1 Tax=Gillisia lutea TaxID=2909668 RepID=A0ABS9EJV3_9FLAO|nr:endo-1,4-beta-xylanase [Gillisia lutea]MCF4101763.1 endo-1,4-beta-xylanase [Gillisia lutea]
MKYTKLIPIIVLSSVMFSSCEDNYMEWQEVPDANKITSAELPLELQEKISRYEALNSYTDFTLGAGIVLDLYMNNDSYRNLVIENFDDVTVGYAMKHGPMVNSQGEIEFETVDNFIASVRDAGLDVYGHTLVWHANQNASYLNGLISPIVIPGSSGANSLDLSSLQAGTLDGWGGSWNSAISIVDGKGLSDSSKAVQMVADGTANPWELQLGTPNIPIVSGHSYEVSFYIKSDQPGKGRISFDTNLSNQYPWFDWYSSGSQTEAFETSSEWKQVKFTLDASNFVTGATTFMFNFDLGYLSGVTYLIDVDNISVVDLDAQPENMIANGDFEDGTISPWNGWGNGSSREVSAAGDGFGGTGYAMVLNNSVAASNYSAQQVYTFSQPLEMGKEYTCSFWVKSTSSSANLQVQIQSDDYSADYYGGIVVGNSWTKVEFPVTPTTDNRTKLIFDFGETATTYYFDDIVFTSGEAGGGSGPTIIEKTDEEKTEIIGDAMEDWISKMVSHYKDDVFAWDVVNEPMKEGGSLRDGNVAELADDDFYWVKYLGKDYAVTAFKLARQYGNPTDKLFINDYNLESSLEKCDGLIEYVQYIESKGATVDGIGTQMHISLNSDKDKIIQMFQKLAASGKLIKISELDVRLGTNSPTVAQLADQAAMYQFVIDSFKEHIPASQQYGVTLWNISDNANEHEFWLPNEAPNVWDANYARKHAYKGVADGLAGRDVSEDFSGEIEY